MFECSCEKLTNKLNWIYRDKAKVLGYDYALGLISMAYDLDRISLDEYLSLTEEIKIID